MISEQIMTEVERALDAGAETPRQIHKRMGRWSVITVRHALRQLVDAGRVTFSGEDSHRRYRRVR